MRTEPVILRGGRIVGVKCWGESQEVSRWWSEWLLERQAVEGILLLRKSWGVYI